MSRPWTTREIATLREKYGKVAAGIIALELGRTTKAAQALLAKLESKPPRTKKEKR